MGGLVFGEVRYLMPVWGRRHVRQFLEFGLPSMMAPGNIPAVAAQRPSVFVLLTRERDLAEVENHPAWIALQEICAACVEVIDDLVSRSSSTVLTLAYVRGIRARGAEATSTTFIFLVGDYIVADGSFSRVVARVAAGASGVLVGNFQMTEEGARPSLDQFRDQSGTRLTATSRDLAGLALRHLHPATIAGLADDPFQHDPATNRFFWRLDRTALLGRFYLMHMIAIRPETADFTIAAPSDYALIPVLCGSGEIDVITDSDEYFVVEMQPAKEPRPAFRFGPLTPSAVASEVKGWATRQHLDNVRHTLVFHTGQPLPNLPQIARAADAFVDEVTARIDADPQPFANHPIWARSLDYHLATAPSAKAGAAVADLQGGSLSQRSRTNDSGGRARRSLLGRAPNLQPWHPRWADFKLVRDRFGSESRNAVVLVVSDAPADVRDAFACAARAGGALDVDFSSLDDAELGRNTNAKRFDLCLLIATQSGSNLTRLLPIVADILAPGGRFLISLGDVAGEESEFIVPEQFQHVDLLEDGLFEQCRIETVGASRFRADVQDAMMHLARSAVRGSSSGARLRLVMAAALAPWSLACNWVALAATQRSGARRCSSVLIRLSRRAGAGRHPVRDAVGMAKRIDERHGIAENA